MTIAEQQALANWTANLAALAQRQPHLADVLRQQSLAGVEWVFGRDGALTARVAGQWLGGCSLPRSAAQRMLASLTVQGAVGCFVAPTHASQISAALARMEHHQGLIALMPDSDSCWLALHCEDFARELAAGRLYFAAGDDWAAKLSQLLIDYPGLSVPQVFVKTPLLDEHEGTALMARAQDVIATETRRRASEIERLKLRPARAADNTSVVVIAPSKFRLWEDAGISLLELMQSGGACQCIHIDPDRPDRASSLLLAQAAGDARAVLVANQTRRQLPPVIPSRMAVVTYVAGGRIPATGEAGENDVLIVPDEATAERVRRMGWSAARVEVGVVPGAALADRSTAARGGVAIIADTMRCASPPCAFELSSHQLLWDLIYQELSQTPLTLTDVAEYLSARMKRLGIASAGFDAMFFVERLIMPAYQQGIARLLRQHGVEVGLYGRGWSSIDAFADCARGAIGSRDELSRALAEASVVMNVWPAAAAHPVAYCGRAVLAAWDHRDPSALVARARGLMHNAQPASPATMLTSRAIIGLVGRCRTAARAGAA